MLILFWWEKVYFIMREIAYLSEKPSGNFIKMKGSVLA